jgi:kynurenine formamidase
VAASAQDRSREKDASSFVAALKSARVIELNFVWDRNSPLLGLNPPFSIGLHTSHKQTTGVIPGGIAFSADMMFFSGQHGAPTIDALGHISDNGKLFNGTDALANDGAAGLASLGIEAYPTDKLLNRAVLLDIARFKKVEALAPGQEITAEDLESCARAQGVEIRPGDSVLIRTGYGKYFETDKAKFTGPRPGPGEGAARWLASKRVFLVGDDQMSFEVVTDKGSLFPCHRILIGDSGIYIVENLNLEELGRVLSDQRAWEFVLVLNPPRIRGATGMAVNAFAIIPR